MPSDELHHDLRAWARGTDTREAAVELLAWGGRAIDPGAPWVVRGTDRASIDWDCLAYESGAWSSVERAMVAIACSLVGGDPVDLSDVIPRLWRRHLEAVLAAIAHAGGAHRHGDLMAVDGRPVFAPVEPLYAWPS